MPKIKLLLVDDQELFVKSLKRVIEADAPDIEVVGIAGNGVDAISAVQGLKPDLVFLRQARGVHRVPAGLDQMPPLPAHRVAKRIEIGALAPGEQQRGGNGRTKKESGNLHISFPVIRVFCSCPSTSVDAAIITASRTSRPCLPA